MSKRPRRKFETGFKKQLVAQIEGAGIVIAYSFSIGAYEECKRIQNEKGFIVDLIETRDLLRDAS